MNENQTNDHWADGHSFLGKIYLLDASGRLPVHIFKSHHDLSFGVNIKTDDGWLKVGGDFAAPGFQFRFHSKAKDRLHFNISLASNSRRKLGASSEGYLGLYEQEAELDYWKLQPLAWSRHELRCLIRDHLGHQIKSTHTPGTNIAYLTTAEGTPHEFVIERSR
ncbi:hypothetical protein [Pseudomonas sp. Teo4]|uniref:hypothetical protein n=1 Tax=Pseudomonas sp. Teo4 TaxID=3064528 RepID=UPI002AB9DBF0|nr:hypothetical protein [Pseudomonas sp. Teo4]MDZ3995280.1 hypothetical protein [Pseudomonas sp. Teo4]